MIKRFFFFPFLHLIGGCLTASVILKSWALRHPYLVFFDSKTIVYTRFIGISALFCTLFFLFYKAFSYLMGPRQKFKFTYLLTDVLINGALAWILTYRSHIDSRKQGNLFTIYVFSLWVMIKILFYLWKADKVQLKAVPSLLFQTLKKIKNPLRIRKKINLPFYLLIGALFYSFILFLSSALPSWSKYLPLLYVCSFLSFLIALDFSLSAIFKRPGHLLFQYFSLLICLCVALDTFNFLLLNTHMNASLGALFSEGILGTLQALEGADINPFYFILVTLSIFLIPLLAPWINKKLPEKKVQLSIFFPLIFFSCSTIGCYFTEHKIGLDSPAYITQALSKSLSPYAFFLKARGEELKTTKCFQSLDQYNQLPSQIPSLKAEKKPHIFVLVIESFRDDYITEETSPFISSLKKESIPFKHTASNSNVTHCSLFTLYHSLYPNHWMEIRDHAQTQGSLPLRILKQSGYSLHAFHSSFFRYFQMTDCLFGPQANLLNTLYEAKHKEDNVAIRDQLALNAAKKTLNQVDLDKPQFVTILLDSTHHHYYWPENFKVPYTPFLKSFNYANRSKTQLQLVKNRYKNSIYYVDSLVRDFCDFLKQKEIYDSSVIIITGDHGEEFMESGHYFHGTDLCFEQSKVPILYRLPKELSKPSKTDLTSHVDIFPSIFDLMGLSLPSHCFEGKSIFSKHPGFILSFKPKNNQAPCEFYLFDGKEKIEAQRLYPLSKNQEVFEIQAIKDPMEQNLISDFKRATLEPKIEKMHGYLKTISETE